MKILIISDLHANQEALGALPTAYDQMWVLGDLVNYGPDPAAVVDFVREHASLVVRGNHDDAIGYGRDPQCSAPFRRMAAEMARYTLSVLDEERREYLRHLPLVAGRDVGGVRFLACHATPGHPLHEYRPADSELWKADASRSLRDVLLTGHTHFPFIRSVAGSVIANPGSVGQAKNEGGRACYAIWENGGLRLESVAYAVEETVAKLRNLPVDEVVKRQLASVLRTGVADSIG